MKKVIFIMISICILISAVIVFFIINTPEKKLSESEKEAALTKLLGRKVNLKEKNVPQGDTDFKGKYLTFKYPKSASEMKPMLNGTPIPQDNLESFIFNIDNPKIAVFVEVAEVVDSVKSVSDYPSVRLRDLQGDIYKKTNVLVDEINGSIYTKSDINGYEKTAFFYINGRIYSLSFQGRNSQAIDQLFEKIISSVKFIND